MSALTVRPLNPLEWLGGPALACALATLLFAVPARLFGLQLPEPVFPMAAAFAWATIRPSVLPPFVLLALGLFLDLLWGGPLGLWPICLLAAYAPVLFVQRSVSQLGFVSLWASYAVVCALSLGVGWILASLRAGIAINILGVAWQYLSTSLLFPIAFLVIQRYERANVRYR
jgi:rod shape-determining protein MreD